LGFYDNSNQKKHQKLHKTSLLGEQPEAGGKMTPRFAFSVSCGTQDAKPIGTRLAGEIAAEEVASFLRPLYEYELHG
jgi:hypothetical protein